MNKSDYKRELEDEEQKKYLKNFWILYIEVINLNENKYEEIYLDEGQELTDLIQEWINDENILMKITDIK